MKTVSAVDLARKYLEDKIIKGSFHPGRKIKEEEVSSKLGISRPPIREAFKILEADGLIIKRPNKGVFVSEINRKDVWEIYTLKAALYELATSLAFDKISEKDIKKLEKIVQRMEECAKYENTNNVYKYQSLNHSFHYVVIDIAGHQRLKNVVLSLDNQVKRLSYKSLENKRHLKKSCKYHRIIFEAIKNGDCPLTQRLTREHVIEAFKVREKIMDE